MAELAPEPAAELAVEPVVASHEPVTTPHEAVVGGSWEAMAGYFHHWTMLKLVFPIVICLVYAFVGDPVSKPHWAIWRHALVLSM